MNYLNLFRFTTLNAEKLYCEFVISASISTADLVVNLPKNFVNRLDIMVSEIQVFELESSSLKLIKLGPIFELKFELEAEFDGSILNGP